MGLFDLFFGGGGHYNRRNGGMTEEYRQALREMRKQKSKLYRTVRTVVIIVTALVTALLILGFFVPDLRHAWLFEGVFIIYAFCAAGGTALPWITEFERDRRKIAKGETVAPWRKIIVYVFWGLIGVAAILWAISVIVIGDDIMEILGIAGSASGENTHLQATFAMLRISVIFTLQVAVGSVIVTSTMRYGKKYFALRLIMYITIAYLDLWLTWFVGGVTVARLENGFAPISVTALWVLAVLMAVGLLVSGSIFGSQARRKEIELFMKGDVEALTDGDVDLIDVQASSNKDKKEAPSSAPAKDPVEQLTKLKELLEKGIITEEEYQAKRKDILEKM